MKLMMLGLGLVVAVIPPCFSQTNQSSQTESSRTSPLPRALTDSDLVTLRSRYRDLYYIVFMPMLVQHQRRVDLLDNKANHLAPVAVFPVVDDLAHASDRRRAERPHLGIEPAKLDERESYFIGPYDAHKNGYNENSGGKADIAGGPSWDICRGLVDHLAAAASSAGTQNDACCDPVLSK